MIYSCMGNVLFSFGPPVSLLFSIDPQSKAKQAAVLTEIGSLPTAQILALMTPTSALDHASIAASLVQTGHDGLLEAGAGSLMQWQASTLAEEAHQSTTAGWLKKLKDAEALCTDEENMDQLRKAILGVKG